MNNSFSRSTNARDVNDCSPHRHVSAVYHGNGGDVDYSIRYRLKHSLPVDVDPRATQLDEALFHFKSGTRNWCETAKSN